MAAIARPLVSDASHKVEELARRFERLTSLSTLASLGFALGVVSLCAMVAWPLSIHNLSEDFANAKTPLVALFGLKLTVALVAGYFPTAMILGQN